MISSMLLGMSAAEEKAADVPIVRKYRKLFIFIAIFIAISGTVGFTMFVLEESMQTLMFASFNYKNVEDWDGLRTHVAIMESQADFNAVYIRTIGLLSPYMLPAYLQYDKANRQYIKSVRAQIAKHK